MVAYCYHAIITIYNLFKEIFCIPLIFIPSLGKQKGKNPVYFSLLIHYFNFLPTYLHSTAADIYHPHASTQPCLGVHTDQM